MIGHSMGWHIIIGFIWMWIYGYAWLVQCKCGKVLEYQRLIFYTNMPYPKFISRIPNHNQYHHNCLMLISITWSILQSLVLIWSFLLCCMARHLRRLNQIYGKGDIGLLFNISLIYVVASNFNIPAVKLIWYHCVGT